MAKPKRPPFEKFKKSSANDGDEDDAKYGKKKGKFPPFTAKDQAKAMRSA